SFNINNFSFEHFHPVTPTSEKPTQDRNRISPDGTTVNNPSKKTSRSGDKERCKRDKAYDKANEAVMP
ncbi:MAG: hypothetical protein AAGA67_11035, partial [Cyanobacteria bacterium P01_F01_bin.153]